MVKINGNKIFQILSYERKKQISVQRFSYRKDDEDDF